MTRTGEDFKNGSYHYCEKNIPEEMFLVLFFSFLIFICIDFKITHIKLIIFLL